jgi:hypothetical protein
LKIKHPELCCEKTLEIKYTKSVGSAKNSWKPSRLLLVEYARRHFGTKHLLLLELQTRLWNQAPTFVWYANKKKNSWRSSKALTSVGYAKEHLKTKHLLSVGYAKEHLKTKHLLSVGDAKEHLKTKHLLSAGYAKTAPHFENPALDFCWVRKNNTWKSSTYFCWVCKKKKKQLKIKHLLLLLGMPETPEIHNNLRQIGLPILATITQTNNHSTLIENKILFPSAAPYLRFAWSKLSLL